MQQQQLGDAVAVMNGKRLVSLIHQVDPQLSPVIGVDETHAVGKADAVFGGQARPGQQKTAEMLWNGHAQAGGNQLPLAGSDGHFSLLRQEGGDIHGRRVLGLILGQGRLFAAALQLPDEQPGPEVC